MSKIGYIRVSTEHQETARQQEIMSNTIPIVSSPRSFQEQPQTAHSSGQCLTMCVWVIPSMWRASVV